MIFLDLLIFLRYWKQLNLCYSNNLAFDNYDLNRSQNQNFQSFLNRLPVQIIQRHLVSHAGHFRCSFSSDRYYQWALLLAVRLGHSLFLQSHPLLCSRYESYFPNTRETIWINSKVKGMGVSGHSWKHFSTVRRPFLLGDSLRFSQLCSHCPILFYKMNTMFFVFEDQVLHWHGAISNEPKK